MQHHSPYFPFPQCCNAKAYYEIRDILVAFDLPDKRRRSAVVLHLLLRRYVVPPYHDVVPEL